MLGMRISDEISTHPEQEQESHHYPQVRITPLLNQWGSFKSVCSHRQRCISPTPNFALLWSHRAFIVDDYFIRSLGFGILEVFPAFNLILKITRKPLIQQVLHIKWNGFVIVRSLNHNIVLIGLLPKFHKALHKVFIHVSSFSIMYFCFHYMPFIFCPNPTLSLYFLSHWPKLKSQERFTFHLHCQSHSVNHQVQRIKKFSQMHMPVQ